jgi:hypothetical protein
VRQLLEGRRGSADEGVADILARQEGGKLEPVRQARRHVLGRMHGEVEVARVQLRLDLLGEEALATDFGQGPIGDAVAFRGEHDDLEHLFGQPVRRHQAIPSLMRLRQCQRAAARADPERFCLHPP